MRCQDVSRRVKTCQDVRRAEAAKVHWVAAHWTLELWNIKFSGEHWRTSPGSIWESHHQGYQWAAGWSAASFHAFLLASQPQTMGTTCRFALDTFSAFKQWYMVICDAIKEKAIFNWTSCIFLSVFAPLFLISLRFSCDAHADFLFLELISNGGL